MFNFVVFLSEKAQTWIKALLVIFILVIAILLLFALIGKLIEITMKWQSNKVDEYMSNLVTSKLINKPENFKRIAKKKSYIVFFQQSIAPLILIVVGVIVWLVYHTVIKGKWDESIFDYNTGILTLFYIPEWKSIEVIFGTEKFLKINVNWLNKPHFLEGGQICNYIIFLLTMGGAFWFLINIQAFASRLYKIRILKRSMYSKDLSKIDLSHFYNLDRINPFKHKEKKEAEQEQKENENKSINN